MCDPVVGFAVLGGAQAVAGQMGKMSQKNAKNEALADDYENRKTNYVNNLAIDYARYQNEKIDYQINSDVVFKSFVAKYIGDQKRINQLESADLRNQQQALIALARKAYAGPLTGVTAARLAAQPLRNVGIQRAAQVAQLTERTEALEAGSEFAYQQTLDKLNNEYGKVAMAPVAGFEPLAPEFDYDAELGSFAMNLASGIGSGYLAGKSMMPGGGAAPPPGGVSAASTATTKFTNPASYLKAPTPSSMTGGASFDFFNKFPSGNNFLMDQRVTPLSTFS